MLTRRQIKMRDWQHWQVKPTLDGTGAIDNAAVEQMNRASGMGSVARIVGHYTNSRARAI